MQTQKGRKKHPVQIASNDSVTMSCQQVVDDAGNIAVKSIWQINSDTPTVFEDSFHFDREDGLGLSTFAAGLTGYTTGFSAPKNGSCLDSGHSDDTLNYPNYIKPFQPGDKVIYQLLVSMGDLDNHYSVYGPAIEVVIV